MYTLYSMRRSGNCYKVRLALAQLDIPHELIEIDILKGETRTPEYLKLNSAGQVPAIELDDGRTLAQSNAIIRYLARGSPLIPADAYAAADHVSGAAEPAESTATRTRARCWGNCAEHARKLIARRRMPARCTTATASAHQLFLPGSGNVRLNVGGHHHRNGLFRNLLHSLVSAGKNQEWNDAAVNQDRRNAGPSFVLICAPDVFSWYRFRGYFKRRQLGWIDRVANILY